MYSKIILFILLPLFAFSQAPQKINFQSILRNTNGEVVANKSVSLKISILSGSTSVSSVYAETHTKTTDASGLISLQIGNGTVLSGVFANIGWGDAPHFIKLEADFSGGSNFVVLGTQELMSVPYALYASKTDTSSLNLVNRFSSKVNISDTSTMLTNYRTGLNDKVNVSDTSNMLTNYRTGLNDKVNVSDTSNMLTNYRTGLNEKVNVSDTSTMLTNYRTGLNEKVNVSDTSNMLTNYRTGLNDKVNVSDTSTMLNPYLRKASIQNSTLELFGIHSWEYPEGFSKDIYFISRNDLPYTVPMGKNLYFITNGNFITINGLPYKTQSGTVFKEGTIFESFMDGPTGLVPGINIFLINKTNKIVPVFFPLNCSNLTYTVPVGKLFITNGTAGNTRFIINNVFIPIGTGDVCIIPEGSILKNCGTEQPWGLNGYLIDK